MIENTKPEDILFLDIETVPVSPAYDNLDPSVKILWEKKSSQFMTPEQTAADVYDKASLLSEFGKIICISAGMIKGKDPMSFRLKSFFGDDEQLLLSRFSSMLVRFTGSKSNALLCAHNGKEFDFPFIARRMIINRLPLPGLLDNAGKKPWEIKLIDTMELWKFGSYRYYTSLDLLTSVLGIPTPKDDIDGSMVAGIYYDDNDIERIVRYCEKDVLAIARILLRFMNLPGIEDVNVESVTF
jgi:3'-5' exonuclease